MQSILHVYQAVLNRHGFTLTRITVKVVQTGGQVAYGLHKRFD